MMCIGMFMAILDVQVVATSLPNIQGALLLPLEPLWLVALVDELRPNAAEALAAFGRLGIRLKIISGDDQRTVIAVARQAGLKGDLPSVTGPELEAMSAEAFDQAAEDATVLGRISPA